MPPTGGQGEGPVPPYARGSVSLAISLSCAGRTGEEQHGGEQRRRQRPGGSCRGVG
jgi:hypothetical protein